MDFHRSPAGTGRGPTVPWSIVGVFFLWLALAGAVARPDDRAGAPGRSIDDILCTAGGDSRKVDQGAGFDQDDAGDAGEPEDRRPLVYLTREDRREAGIRREILPWLTVAGLLESEWSRERLAPTGGGSRSVDGELANALQLAAEITPFEWSKIELIYEYEDDDDFNRHVLDEAVLSIELGDFEWEVGRLYPPFGEYFSQFVEGPVLEFGETRAPGMNLSYSPKETLDLKVYAFEGRERPGANERFEWGVSAEASPIPSGTLGISYISDMSSAMDPVVEPEDLDDSASVDGISGYAVFGFGQLEFNAEFVSALDRYHGLEAGRDRPMAWNGELAWFPEERFQLSFRIEGSSEIPDAPQSRIGIGGAWWVADRMVVRLEYLYGEYERGLAEDDLERSLDHQDLVAAQFSIEF